MKLGISSFTYSWAVGIPGYPVERPLTLLGLLEKAQALGVRVLQIGDNLPLHALPEPELAAFARAARAQGVAIETGTRGIAPDHLRTYLRLAVRLGSPILRVVIDTATHEPDADEVVATLQPLAGDFAAANVTLAIENHDRFRAQELAEIVRRLGPWVGICLDTVNSLGALEGPDIVVQVLGPLAVNLHVKDFCVQRVPYKLGLVVTGSPAGRGRLDVPWLLQRLHEMGRDVNAILEQWTPQQATIAETIALEDAWARESVAYLQALLAQEKTR